MPHLVDMLVIGDASITDVLPLNRLRSTRLLNDMRQLVREQITTR